MYYKTIYEDVTTDLYQDIRNLYSLSMKQEISWTIAKIMNYQLYNNQDD